MLNGMMILTEPNIGCGKFYRINGLVSSTKKWHDKKGMGVVH